MTNGKMLEIEQGKCITIIREYLFPTFILVNSVIGNTIESKVSINKFQRSLEKPKILNGNKNIL